MQKTWQRLSQQPQLQAPFRVREVVIDTIRGFFKTQDFLEVETPLLVQRPSTETFLDFFGSELRMAEGQRRPGFLTTSPEYAMKKILVAGFPRVFQVCKSFRNGEGRSPKHNPEFTILEWYRTQADYTDIMRDCEELMLELVAAVNEWRGEAVIPDVEPTLQYQGRTYHLNAPWPRLSVAEAFEQFAGIEVEELLDEVALPKRAATKGYQVTDATSWEQAYHQIFLNEVEPALTQFDRPVFLYDYPTSQAALSRRKADDPRFAERFELYLGGIELGNAFSELIDADEQEARLKADLELRRKEQRPPFELDTDFIEALRLGMPPTGGIAVGVDRLVMLLADVPSIKDTLFFPVEDVFDLE